MDWCGMLEELNVVLTDSAGQAVKTDDLRNYTGAISYRLLDPEPVSTQAQNLHSVGRNQSERGRYQEAIVSFLEAHEIVPTWPYPLYDLAFTYLLMGDTENAFRYYQEVDELAPEGFFTTKVAVDILNREVEGALENGTYLALVSIEFMTDEAQQLAIVKQILAKSEEVPPAWNLLAKFAENDEAALAAIERGLEHEPDPHTRGSLLISKALLLERAGDRAGSMELMESLALDPTSTVGNRAEALLSLCLSSLSD